MALLFANNNSLSAITAKPSGLTGGALNLISTQTASSSSTISFTSGIDSTYDVYMFKFYDIHTSSAGDLTFQADTGTNTNYNQTITSTLFQSIHSEDGTSEAGLAYVSANDQSQGTAFQDIYLNAGNGNDECIAGTLHLFDPSNTTFVKHFISRIQGYHNANSSFEYFCAGYINTTTALTRAQFKFSSGNIDSGTIKLYGVS